MFSKKKSKEIEETKSHLEDELLRSGDTIKSLELELDKCKTMNPNINSVLENIESEKVAASRAVSQNQLLKEQLEEMQGAFIRTVIFPLI